MLCPSRSMLPVCSDFPVTTGEITTPDDVEELGPQGESPEAERDGTRGLTQPPHARSVDTARGLPPIEEAMQGKNMLAEMRSSLKVDGGHECREPHECTGHTVSSAAPQEESGSDPEPCGYAGSPLAAERAVCPPRVRDDDSGYHRGGHLMMMRGCPTPDCQTMAVVDSDEDMATAGDEVHVLFRRYYTSRRSHISQPTGSPYVSIAFEHAEDLPFRALLDSGATHSVLSVRAMEKLAQRVGEAAARLWPVQAPNMTVTMADGKRQTPKGAVVLTLGLRTLQGGYVWAEFPFLVLENVVDDVILGSDWEAETSATRFPPARVLGVSMTSESRATYAEWASHIVRGGTVLQDVPAYAFTHVVPFSVHASAKADETDIVRVRSAHAEEPAESPTGSIARVQPRPDPRAVSPSTTRSRDQRVTTHADARSVSHESMLGERGVLGERVSTFDLTDALEPRMNNARHRAAPTVRGTTAPPAPGAAYRSPHGGTRPIATLRSLRALVIPPMSEIGPLPVSVHWKGRGRPL